MKTTAIILFVLTYVLMIALPKYRHLVAMVSAAVFVILGILPVSDVFASVDWNIIMMLIGTMGTVSLFIESKMPNRLADLLINKTPNVMIAAVVMSLFAGFVSAFVDNVATLLMIAPVGLATAKKLKISPVPLLISISVSSNLQGAATLVGDTTSILLGGYAGMDFLDFFLLDGKLSIFWAVELGALATVPVIMFLFRKDKGAIAKSQITEVNDMVPSVLLVLNVVLLIIASFIPEKPAITNGVICLAICMFGVVRAYIKKGSFDIVKQVAHDIDYVTICLLAGLFIVIAGITKAGVIEDLSQLFVTIGGDNLFLMYSLLVWGSVLLSAFIDNIPYVATMLPVVTSIASIMGVSPYLLYFGLLSGATLGGNLSPIGASANIAAIGILRKNGYEVKTTDFFRIGIPFTITAVVTSYIFCWIIWA